MNRPNITDAALSYIGRGWSFYPTRPRSKEPFTEILPRVEGKDGKTRAAWSPFQTERPTPRDARVWFQVAPMANLAIITGQISGLVILDCDSPEAEAALRDFCGCSLDTPTVLSRRGAHLYFAHPMDREVRGTLDIPDVDLKGDGGCCTAPPSIHSSGYVYQWITLPGECDLMPLPPAILAHLDAKAAQKRAPLAATANVVTQPGHPYAKTSLQNAVAEIANTRDNRHNKLRGVAYGIGRLVGSGALDLATAFGALMNAAAQAGYPTRKSERVIDDSLRAGMADPRLIENRPAPMPQTGRKPRTLAQLRGAM